MNTDKKNPNDIDVYADDDLADFIALFDSPHQPKPLREEKPKKPKRCAMCGTKTKKLKPAMVGKTTLYICKFCYRLITQ